MGLLEIFNGLNKDILDSYVQEKKQEDLHLDFKTVNSNITSENDKKNYAKSVSGFANSDGGIIIWGVDCRKNSDGADCAESIVPIKNIEAFLSKLNALSNEVCSPSIDGLQHKIIFKSGTEGCAATFVPVSDSGPHMAKLGEQRYYKRSGSNFYKMEHYDLEDMFGRRQRPSLNLKVHRGKDSQSSEYTFKLINSGRAPTKHLNSCVNISSRRECPFIGR